MAGGEFVSADITAIAKFMEDSAEVIKEFDSIKSEFNTINETLLKKWKGEGADAYKYETDHILENIGGIKDVLDAINNSAVKSIREEYSKLDEELGEFNKNPSSE